jgi:3',5'-cyclic AMP phosphodiesterase CpdA
MPTLRATIVQISDLHLHLRSDKSVQSMVKFIIGRERPDVLIVSGDLANQPVPWQMRRAAKFVRDVYSVCSEHAQLMVISGNHDFKFWGNFGLRRLTRVPFEIYFRLGGIKHGIFWRLVRYVGLSLHALWPWSERLRDPLQFLTLQNLGITLVGFNSNTLTEMMAAGRVEPKDLQDLYGRFDQSAADPAFGFHYKIAVVHHHPAPIADVDTKLASRIQESFMVFYNAGSFLREINRRGFNLVVHGHKHFAGMLRVSSEFGEQHRAVVPIAAAGSACHNHPDDPRGHHLHVIRLFDDDTATLRSLFFSGSVESTESTRTYLLDGREDVQRRRYNAFRDLQGFTVREIRKTSRITNDGYTDVQIELFRFRVNSTAGLESHPIEYQAAEPAYLRAFEGMDLPGSPRFLKLVPKIKALRVFSGSMEFGRRYVPEDAPFDFGLKYRLINGHTLTPREFQRHYAGKMQELEDASLFCYVPTEILTLEVHFPSGCQMDDCHVEPRAEYAPAPLKGVRDADFDWNALKPHEHESARARDSLQILPSAFRLTIHNPIPGFLYRIRWFPKEQPGAKVNSLAPRVTLEDEARAVRVQDELLTIARGVAAGVADVGGKYDSIAAPLRTLAEDFTKVNNLKGERIDVGIMVFHREDTRLHTVCATFGEIAELLKETFVSGEGCAGFVFEKVRPLLYHPARDTIGYFVRPEERPGCGSGLLQPTVLLCFPWVEAGIVVGVVNVSTQQQDSGFLRLFDLPPTDAEKENALMQELVRRAAHNVYTIVAEGKYASNLESRRER